MAKIGGSTEPVYQCLNCRRITESAQRILNWSPWKGKMSGLYLSQVLIHNANDCHPNPDPRSPKFPCQVCSKACTWSKKIRSIACNNCELWFHTDCLKMTSAIYDALNNTDSSWYCCNCGIPNFNSSLFEDFPFQDNSLTTPTTPSGLHSFSSDSLSIGSPKLTSSPKRKQPKPLFENNLRILTINFQSLRSKREELWTLLEFSTPDIIIATETWLQPSIYKREVLPENYRFAEMRDRKSSPHGGVAIITKAD